MAKYVITAKNIFEGNSKSDVASPLQSTELATEMIITRLKAIELLNDKIIAEDSIIVTRKDRFCLYEEIFNDCMDYQDFLKLDVAEHEVIDLVSQIYILCETINYKPRYARYDLDKNEIHKIKCFDFDGIIDPFACVLIRKRAAWSEKNLPDEYWQDLISELKKKFSAVFVFGKDAEHFEKKHDNIHHVSSLWEWCGLLKNEYCSSVISTTTGGVYPIFFVGHKNSNLIIIDNNDLLSKHGDDPSFYNECINFTGVKVTSFSFVPEQKTIAEIA